MPIINKPVANGSKVPPWPIFLTPKKCFKNETTSWLVQWIGLLTAKIWSFKNCSKKESISAFVYNWLFFLCHKNQ
ncbi:hypothetical protein MCAV_07980 [[Mycoplasma] cavipharyngis]|uniref:hypothetical protein n=1 Tax=[Mycoplasma] cavipharyngis TaxID=92757 RepID=UPI0037042B1D